MTAVSGTVEEPVASAARDPRPLGPDPADVPAPRGSAAGHAAVADDPAPRLLLIEDNAADAALTQAQVRAVRPDVLFEHAVRLADVTAERAAWATCALVDLSLPDASGIEVVAQVRQLAPALPIIVLTGLDDLSTGLLSLRQGAQDYLVKNHADGFTLDRAVRYATERLRLERQLAEQAMRDPLTGLANRQLFLQRCNQALLRARLTGELVVVLLADLDRFKDVNDALGHVAGDELLVQLADRLAGVMRPDDTLARLGGDEFTVLCEGLGRVEEAQEVAERLLRAVAAPFSVDGGFTVHVGMSIGVSRTGPDQLDAGLLLRDADTALYEAKDDGRGRVVWFTPQIRARTVRRVTLEVGLRTAIRLRQGLSVECEPIMDLDEDRPVMIEALARWTHHEFGSVPPATFIPLAERSDLIVELDLAVLDLGLARLLEIGAPHDTLRLSVNASGRSLRHADYVTQVGEALRRADVPPARLTIEILETALLDDAAVLAVGRLRALGVAIALDDFGAGPSSLQHVLTMSVDVLKLDRSFLVATGLGDPRAAAVLRAITTIGRDLDLDIIAEGIETPADLALIRSLGVHLAQGWMWPSS